MALTHTDTSDTDLMIARSGTVGLDLEAELRTQHAHVQLVRLKFAEPPDVLFQISDALLVGLCPASQHRTARGCFPHLPRASHLQKMGALFVVPQGISMRAFSDECSSFATILCTLDGTVLKELLECYPDLADPTCIAQTDVREPHVRQLLLKLREEVECPGFGSKLAADSIAIQIAVELYRSVLRTSKEALYSGLAPWQLKVIDGRLKEVARTPTLTELAALCRVSVRQMSRAFQVSRRCSIGTYVTQMQLEHAKRLLTTSATIAEISETLGFASPSNFCFAFRRETGLSPGAFRRQAPSALPPSS